jgi:thiamine transporter ThiT
MLSNIKRKKFNCIVSAVAIIFAALYILLSFLNNESLGSSIAIFCSMIAIFVVNIRTYQVQLKKEKDNTL